LDRSLDAQVPVTDPLRDAHRGQVAGCFDLKREARDPRIICVLPCSAHAFSPISRVTTMDELNDHFGALLCGAYEVGAGHVSAVDFPRSA